MYLYMIRSEILKGHSEKQAIRPNKYILVQNTTLFPVSWLYHLKIL